MPFKNVSYLQPSWPACLAEGAMSVILVDHFEKNICENIMDLNLNQWFQRRALVVILIGRVESARQLWQRAL